MASAVINALGHHMARVDTVQLIAHPGHGIRAGGSLSDIDFEALIDGLTRLKFDAQIDAVMTGYIGQSSQISTLAKHLSELHQHRPDISIMVDPAIGDHGRLYVDDAIAEGIEKKLIPLAHVITPNAYEFSRLTGLSSLNGTEVHDKAKHLLDIYPHLKGMAITGCIESDMVRDFWIDRHDMISHEAPRLAHNTRGMAGGGDLFAAVMMGRHLSGADWRHAFDDAARLSRQIINSADMSGTIDIDLKMVTDGLKKVLNR